MPFLADDVVVVHGNAERAGDDVDLLPHLGIGLPLVHLRISQPTGRMIA